jgi:L-alanine-DL-glutamate epimerase-like enolase superfamily enzyme
MERNSSAKAAVEIAIYDLWGQLYDAPLYKLLGGGDPVITTDITISVDYIDKMVADSIAAVERGFESLKIKVGKDIGVDIERVKAIHAAVENRALLRLDANQGWTAKQAVYALQTLEDAGVKLELVEQPVKARDLEGMRYVTERVHTPIMADESVFGPMQVIELIRLRAADIINIKLMKTGGISNAIRIADIAGMYGVECMIGCMLEGSISVAAAVHVAVAKASVITKIDLDGPSLCTFNPVRGGVIFNESEITVHDAPGLGIQEIEGLEPIAV